LRRSNGCFLKRRKRKRNRKRSSRRSNKRRIKGV
jgi:hypothetical protein